ncbi:DUF2786 domain-containing protein [Aspergillus melleus]|uniref:DUF2786 domain-containing protein n=1 Tax=Aspergillus melleus TaxID=138277 RepID=UPI001E8DC404|nr:uncharacterized protein LDX57_012756 [Aspergillus melleus]KAH8435127.1 hypothetical protein LDX57_012756 [Aspergillus melleus]
MESNLSTHTSRRAKRSKAPVQKATVIKSAEVSPRKTSNNNIDQGILDKIQKCLSRARHASANEGEAKAALFLAQRMMALYNVTHADLLANDDVADKAQYGGRSVVSIQNAHDRTKRVRKETFVDKLANAMCTLYDCKCYSVDRHVSIEWSFFGIAANTVTAAGAFEAVHNKTLQWACAYKGGTPTFSYRMGLADGLVSMAYRIKRRELVEVRRKELDMIAASDREEERRRKEELDRIQRLAPLKVDDDDNNSDDDDDFANNDSGPFITNPSDNMDVDEVGQVRDGGGRADFNEHDIEVIDLTEDVDDNLERLIKRERPKSLKMDNIRQHPVKPEPSATAIKDENTSASPWASEMQLVRFRAMSEQIAEDYLKKRNIKPRERKARPVVARHIDSYRQGWRDSSKIDIPLPSTVT